MIVFTVILMTVMAFGQVETLWQKSAGDNNLPTWFSTANNQRGFGYGTVGENERIYVPSREGVTAVKIVNATDGSDVGDLDVTGIAGGLFVVQDADVSDDGIIFVCNMTLDATGANNPFKVYRWDNESATPTEVIAYSGIKARLGDKFTVVGSASDNSLKIYAAAAPPSGVTELDTVVMFTTSDNGASFTATKIAVGVPHKSSPAVTPVDLGAESFFVNYNGGNAVHFNAADGSLLGTIPGGVLATGSNAMRLIKMPASYYLVAFQYGTGNENARIIDVTAGAADASTFALTPSLYTNANGNGAGDVDVKDNGDGTFNVYVFSTNNGFGAYKVTPPNELFISEYIEGSSNNKALEIYNPADAAVSLDNYQIAQSANGQGWEFYHIFPEGATLAAQDVWVILNAETAPTFFAPGRADEVLPFPSVVHHNGNDARAIIKVAFDDTLFLDVFGDPNSSANFDVAGVAGAAQNHTIVRKDAVTTGNADWAASAGTNADDSEWIVYDQNTFTYLGIHPGVAPEIARVQVIHNSADLAADTVDVWLNDVLLLDNFAFRQATPFVDAPAGAEITIAVKGKDSTDPSNPLWSKNYTLDNNGVYILIASGIVSASGYIPATPFDIAVFPNAREWATSSNNTDVLIYHGITDVPPVDILEMEAGTLVDNISYGTYDGYLSLPTADYIIVVTDSSGVRTLTRRIGPLATLELEGAALTVFASGFAEPDSNSGGPAASLYAASSGGLVVELPPYEAPVKVTFVANTSRIEGVTDTTGGVDLRGSMQGWAAEQNPLNSDGGDYWSIEWTFPDSVVGETQFYKYGVTIKDYLPPNTVTSYWENDAPGADDAASRPNREMVVPYKDMVMPVEYVGHRSPPFMPTDSIDVYFRVNMAAKVDFDPNSGTVYLVGAFPHPDGSDNMWVPDKYPLTRESPTSVYWGYHLWLPEPKDSTMYRFTVGAWDGSEQIFGHGMFPDNENRGVSIGSNDTTLQWVWWNDQPYQGATGTDTVQVKFSVDMTRAILENGFDPGQDKLLVQWGFLASADIAVDTMVYDLISDRYESTVEVTRVTAGKNVLYQYYRNTTTGEDRENFYDFTDKSGNNLSQEKRKLAIPSPAPTTLMAVEDTEDSETSMRRRPTFANNSPISQDVTVYWECNLKPAYYQVKAGSTLGDIQGEIHITPAVLDSIFKWGVWMNGPAVGGWGNPPGTDWGPDLRANLDKKMYDDGATEGDVTAGDSIYTLTWEYTYHPDPDSSDKIGQIYKFGIYGGDNEGGEGGFGLNHKANIDDSQSEYTIHTQWGSTNPLFYVAWDYDAESPTAIEDDPGTGIVIRTTNLRENYPNPFNPSTTLTFELPKQMDVELVIYDVLGRKVNTLVKGMQRAGVHQVIWNGADNYGRAVSSGVYFYRLTTENYSKTLKMVLMR